MNDIAENKRVERGHRKELTGIVVSDKPSKTVIVEVTRRKAHPRYKKVVNIRKRYAVHDEENAARSGDKVRIGETRPLSKNKCWRLLEVMSRVE